MAVYNDHYDNEDEYRADLAWEYRKGGSNDPELYDTGTPEKEEPTDAQIEYAEKLAEIYDVDLKEIPFTKADYSDFIDEFKDM